MPSDWHSWDQPTPEAGTLVILLPASGGRGPAAPSTDQAGPWLKSVRHVSLDSAHKLIGDRERGGVDSKDEYRNKGDGKCKALAQLSLVTQEQD